MAAPAPSPDGPPPPPPPGAPVVADPAPSLQPVQPMLFTAIGNGFLVYCGLIIAAAASLLASLDKVQALPGSRISLGLAAVLALVAGLLALVVMAFAHNHARRVERGADDDVIEGARLATVDWATATLVTTIAATAALIIGFGLFVFADPAPPPTMTVPPITILGPEYRTPEPLSPLPSPPEEPVTEDHAPLDK